MKNSTKAVAAALAAAMSLSCITIYAAGKPTIAKSPFSFSESNNSLRFKAENLSDKNAEASQNLRGTKPEGKGGRMAMPELTEEKKAELAEKLKADLAEKLADEKITQEEYDEAIEKIESGDFRPSGMGGKREMPELTEEKKAELAEKLKADLAEKLADEKITQEEYDEAIEKIESGDFLPSGMGGKREMPELTEEKKAELAEKLKADLTEKLADEKITQEEYDEAIEKIESGDFRPSGKGMGYKKPMCRPERKDTSTDSDLTLA